MAMLQVGMGDGGETAVTGPPPLAPMGKLDQLLGGAKIWLSPSQVPEALRNIGRELEGRPLSVVGFLAVPVLALLLVWGMGAAKRRRARNPRRRRVAVRRRRTTPRRRNPARKAAHDYEVVVGNIGTVYSGRNGFEANKTFGAYVSQSKSNYGRASGESVVLFKDGEITREHEGTVENPRRRSRRNPPAKSARRKIQARQRRNPARRRNQREVVGHAKYVKVRIPFRKSRYQWQYSGPGGYIRIFTSGGPGAVVVSPGYLLDMRSGAVYKDSRF